MTRGLSLQLSLLLIFAATLGCDREPPPLDPLFLGESRFATNRAVEIASSRGFEPRRSGDWAFDQSGRLQVLVTEAPAEGRVLGLRAIEASAGVVLDVFWDGRPLAEGLVVEEEGETLEVPVALMTPGIHHLQLTRLVDRDPGTLVGERWVNLDLHWGRARDMKRLHSMTPETYLLGSFLEFGMTGRTETLRPGLLLREGATEPLEIFSEQPRRLHFDLENMTDEAGVFVVEGGQEGAARFEVDASSARAVQLDLPAGVASLQLSAEGEEGGLFLWGAPWIRRREGRPLVLLTLDTTRKDVLGPWGGPVGLAPEIESIAASSTVFDRALATAPWTLPTHASMFTGLSPGRHGAGVTETRLQRSAETLAEILAAEGYRTGAFIGGHMASSFFGLGQGFGTCRNPPGSEESGDVLTEAATKWVTDLGDAPFFLWVNYFDPHALYQAPPEERARFDVERLAAAVDQLPIWGGLARGEAENLRKVINGEADLTPAAERWLNAAYRAEVASVDRQVGVLRRHLESLDLWDDATVVVVADHGELLGEGGYYTHSCRLDPELIEIPMMIKWPRQREGRRISSLVSQVDLFPTMLRALGLTPPASEGRILSPSTEPAAEGPTAVYFEEHEATVHPLLKSMAVAPHQLGRATTDRWEMVWQGGSECRDRTPRGWVEVECDVSWESWEGPGRGEPIEASPSGGGMSEEDRQKLKALGYL